MFNVDFQLRERTRRGMRGVNVIRYGRGTAVTFAGVVQHSYLHHCHHLEPGCAMDPIDVKSRLNYKVKESWTQLTRDAEPIPIIRDVICTGRL